MNPHFSIVVRAFHAQDKRLQTDTASHPFTTCTNVAKYLKQTFFRERAHVIGYHSDINPTARIGQDVGGHDFILLDERYIVDLWFRYVFGDKHAPLVLDTHRHAREITYYYGDAKTWECCQAPLAGVRVTLMLPSLLTALQPEKPDQ